MSNLISDSSVQNDHYDDVNSLKCKQTHNDEEEACSSLSDDDDDNKSKPTTTTTSRTDTSPRQQQQQVQPVVLMPSALIHHTATKSPKDALQAIYKAGQYKAGLTLRVLAVQSIMAGVYIGMAGQLFLSVGGGLLGAALFPTGLIAVLLTNAELFTGDALIFVASLLGGNVSFGKLCRNWTVSWCFNFVGCLLWALFIGYLSDALQDLGEDDFAVQVALKKANQPWLNIFLKGIGANLMVCVGVWQATCAEEVAGKVLALWFPIAGFVAMGLDHCIANQFLIPVGMMLGADISASKLLFQALLPATLGNLVGGGLCIGAVYWYVFDTMGNTNNGNCVSWERIRSFWRNIGHDRNVEQGENNEQIISSTRQSATPNDSPV